MIHLICYPALIGAIIGLIASVVFANIKRSDLESSNSFNRAQIIQLEAELEALKKKEEYADKILAQTKGERAPCDLCNGCKDLIVYAPHFDGRRWSETQYQCRKNIRCKEYEERAPE